MAEEQLEQEEVTAEEQPQVPKKKGKLKLILLVVFIALGLGAGGTYFFFKDKIMQQFFGAEPKAVEKKKEKKEVGPILSLEPFLFNISGNSSKFAKVTIGVELKDAKILEETKKMVPMVRDKALSVLGSKGPEMLMDVASRNTIKEELGNALKPLFKEQGDITAIYITDIIIQ
jgi:flagellar basal body-associated protein FliL